jgi:hypothetical protein
MDFGTVLVKAACIAAITPVSKFQKPFFYNF